MRPENNTHLTKHIGSIICLSLFPVLSLYLANQKFVELSEVVRPSLLSIVMGMIVYFICARLLKDRQKAYVITVLIASLFFTYGHVYLSQKPDLRHRYLILIWGVIFFAGVWLVIKKLPKDSKIIEFFFVTSVLLLVFPAIQIGRIELNSIQTTSNEEVIAESLGHPDIYYFVTDGYARADVLQREYDFDNSPFLDALAERGFYVANCSQTNYSWTHLSLTSSLNLKYLESQDEAHFDSFRDAAIWPMLKEAGYTTIVFDSGFHRTLKIPSDHLLQLEESKISGLSISDFEIMLLETTMGLLLVDSTSILPISFQPAFSAMKHERFYTKTMFTLDGLTQVADEYDSPKFVYAHVLVPHDPHIFSPEGDYIPEPQNIKIGYINAVQFLNSRLLEFIDAAIKNSKTPPVIIIQSDHGWPWFKPNYRAAILNAYYLPDGGHEVLYDSISPVNTFRSIFNFYWGTDFPILEDRSYYSTKVNAPLDQFEFMPNQCDPNSP